MRLDVYLTENQMSLSRERAKEIIKNGQVSVNGKQVTKPACDINDNDLVEVTGELLKYVSRGGLKLEKALDYFSLDISGKTCMDIGASTGGFTDCMLQNGAQKVYAVDVGTGQLSEKLKNDNRVVSLEQTNIRYVSKEDFPGLFDFISIDVSFISLTLVLPVVRNLLKKEGLCVALIKPQFEAGKEALNKKGVVKSEKTRKKVVEQIRTFSVDMGFNVMGVTESPILGPEGNTEYLMLLALPQEI